jgi:hypothetical protein
MKRAARFLFHISGTGFLFAVGLWFLILYVQTVRGYSPLRASLEPRLPIRVLAVTVLLSTAMAASGTFLMVLDWLLHHTHHPHSRHA